MKTKFFVVGGLTVIVVLVFVFLNSFSDNLNAHRNGFNRTISQLSITQIGKIHIGKDVVEFSQITEDTIILSTKDPKKLLLLTNSLSKMDTLTMSLPVIQNLVPVFYTFVDYPEVNILAGNAKRIITYQLQSGKIDSVNVPSKGGYSSPAQINTGRYIVRAIDMPSFNSKVPVKGFLVNGS